MFRKAILALLTCAAFAYNPPVDTAGPLTVRLDGPQTATQTGSPVPVSVALTSQADAPLEGTVRLAVIDGWKAEPAEARFTVPARGSAQLAFQVTPAPGSLSAHYPIHAFAVFQAGGAKLTAHPVLIVETKLLAAAPAKPPVEWAPVEVRKDSGLALWRLPVYRGVIQVFSDKQPEVLPTGWQGSREPSRANLQMSARIDRGGMREAIGIHPPWSQGHVGTFFVEFPLRLPKQPIKLKFANAMRDGEGGDGVTFRVRVTPLQAPAGTQGVIVYERHTDKKTWQDAEADLSKYAGKDVRLQLESHPGPAKNTAFDQSYWAEPTLIAGTPPVPGSAAAPARTLGKIGEYEVKVSLGPRGLLDAAVTFASTARTTSFQGFPVRVLGDALHDWRSANTLVELEESVGDHYQVRHRFAKFDLVGELWVDGRALRSKFWLENEPEPQPWRVAYIEDASAGPWSAKVTRIYAGVGNVMVQPAAFRLGFDGHRLATSFVGLDFENGMSMVQTVDLPPSEFEHDPASGVSTLHAPHAATFSFIPAANVWDAGKIWRDMNGLTAAPGVPKLAGRFVFDLWGGNFAPSAASLRRAAAYGLVDSIVIWHNWQRWGYDYRLPDIYPPNPRLGTESEFLDLVQTAKRSGMLFAPHDNYIDFYPDADGFTYNDIAFQPSGQPIRAWFNKGRQAQSYRWLTDRFRPYLERNVNLMREGFAPTAFFIDVWSSVGPHDSWSKDGRFIDRLKTRNAWGDAFAWIRNQLGDDAPQISESGHDQLIGWLDGAQTNHLRVDTPPAGEYSWAVWNIQCADAERIPWFDLAHHDRFALHGAGYEPRYASGLDRKQHGMYSDDYIATEVLTGHPAMVGQAFNRDVVRKYWLLHDLGRALALRRIESVDFADGNPHRQHVRWSGGGEVWVNRGVQDWTVNGRVLPQYGFYARVPVESGVVEAAVETRNGSRAEWAKSGSSWFVEGAKWSQSGDHLWITPLPDGKAAQIRFKWEELPWKMNHPHVVNVRREDGGIERVLPVIEDKDGIVLTVEPGAFAYEFL